MALPTASDNPFPSLLVTETAAASIGSPAAGKQRLFVDTDHILKYKSSAGIVSAIDAGASTAAADGWVDDTAETWTYASADSPTFTFTVPTDLTAKYTPGMRLKLTQTTVKYFIVTAVSYSAPNTTVTIYGGTDYTVANAAISLNSHSPSKAPAGFPLDPAKWTQTFSDAVTRTQASPVSGTWYNVGTSLLVVPIGCWRVQYQVLLSVNRSVASGMTQFVTLSTANNTEVDLTMSGFTYSTTATQIVDFVSRERFLTLAAKASYYLNTKTVDTSILQIQYSGVNGTTLIRAICAYL